MALVRISECSWKQICKFGSSPKKTIPKQERKR